jgi:hypothetical protein
MYKFFIFLFIISTCCQAEELESKEKLYSDSISIMEMYSSLFSEPVLYDNKIKKIAKEINLNELNRSERVMFFIYQGLEVSDILSVINESWQNQCDKLKDDDDKKQKLIDLIEKIKELRKKHAAKLEKFIEISFKQINEISNEEKQYFSKRIREWNDNQKLIERSAIE